MLYFIAARSDCTHVKIGTCGDRPRDLRHRLSSLQVGNPALLTVLKTMPGHRDEEKELHQRFAAYRGIGEWFEYRDELKEFVDSLPGKPVLRPAKRVIRRRKFVRGKSKSGCFYLDKKKAAWGPLSD